MFFRVSHETMNRLDLVIVTRITLLALCMKNAAVYSKVSDSDQKTLREQYGRIYDTDKQTLEPEDTLKLLGKLSIELQGTTNEESIVTHNHIEDLITVSRVDPKKCNDYYKNYERAVNLIEVEKDHVNLVALLKDYQRRQFIVCRNGLHDRLRSMLQDISEDVRNKLVILRDCVREATKERSSQLFREAYEKDLVKASLSYMNVIVGPLLSRFAHQPNGREEYAAEFKEKFRKPCLAVVLRVFPAIRVYNLMSFEGEMLSLFDPIEREWLENYNVCSMMMEHGAASANELMDKSYDLLIKDLPRQESRDERILKAKPRREKNFWKKCAGCLGFDK